MGATDYVGNITTYNWDSNNHLLSTGDGLGNLTSFGYVTNLTNHSNRPVKCIFIRAGVGVRISRCPHAPESTHVPRYSQMRLVSHTG